MAAPSCLRVARSVTEIVVTVVSDFVCPWCYIGEHRLARAIEQLSDVSVRIHWMPFQLNAWVPPEGMSRRDYRVHKFGSWERSLQMDAQVAKAAAADGLSIDFTRITRTPNTFDLHRLMRLATGSRHETILARHLFSAYFAEGVDLSDPSQIADVCVRSGLAVQAVMETLSGAAHTDEVTREQDEVRLEGVSGVPEFRIGGQTFRGAVPTPLLVDALTAARARGDHAPAGQTP